MPKEKKTILAIDNILENTYNVITTTSGYLGLDILEIEDKERV